MKTSKAEREWLIHWSRLLSRIHRSLLKEQVLEYEKVEGLVTTPADQLQLMIGDRSFQWMRALSELIVFGDEIESQKEPISQESMTTVVDKTVDLLFDGRNEQFQKRFDFFRPTNTDLLMTLGELKKFIDESEYKPRRS